MPKSFFSNKFWCVHCTCLRGGYLLHIYRFMFMWDNTIYISCASMYNFLVFLWKLCTVIQMSKPSRQTLIILNISTQTTFLVHLQVLFSLNNYMEALLTSAQCNFVVCWGYLNFTFKDTFTIDCGVLAAPKFTKNQFLIISQVILNNSSWKL